MHNSAEREAFRWAWLLLLLDAAEKAAVAPVSNRRLHRLAFFANALAPVYDIPVPDGKVLKYRRGPFYPSLQWDVDRLVVAGLVDMRGFEPREDEIGWWFVAEYCLTSAGTETIAKLTVSPRTARLQPYMDDLVAAFVDVPDEERDLTVERDAVYADPTIAFDNLIDFAEWDDRNFATRNRLGRLIKWCLEAHDYFRETVCICTSDISDVHSKPRADAVDRR